MLSAASPDDWDVHHFLRNSVPILTDEKGGDRYTLRTLTVRVVVFPSFPLHGNADKDPEHPLLGTLSKSQGPTNLCS